VAAHIDRRLIKSISAAGEDSQVEAILVVKEDGGMGVCFNEGFLQKLVEGAIERTGDLPIAIRYFPRANAIVISARTRLIQEILQDENLAVASAVDFDLMDIIFS